MVNLHNPHPGLNMPSPNKRSDKQHYAWNRLLLLGMIVRFNNVLKSVRGSTNEVMTDEERVLIGNIYTSISKLFSIWKENSINGGMNFKEKKQQVEIEIKSRNFF